MTSWFRSLYCNHSSNMEQQQAEGNCQQQSVNGTADTQSPLNHPIGTADQRTEAVMKKKISVSGDPDEGYTIEDGSDGFTEIIDHAHLMAWLCLVGFVGYFAWAVLL